MKREKMHNEGISRRGFLALGALGAAAVLFPGLAAAAARELSVPERGLSLLNLHTDETLNVVYWTCGQYLPESLAAVDAILRDHRTGEVRPIEPRLLDLLFALQGRLDSGAPVHVISGYRSPATNALLHGADPSHVAEHSYHLSGEAIDIRLPDRPLDKVREAALALGAGGVGYYPRSQFVHLDIGPPRHW